MTPDPATSLDPERVRDALRTVIDPEMGENIVDLGLVYRIELRGSMVQIDLTMTSPACPMGEMILEDVHAALRELLPAGYEYKLQLVWEPPWEPSLMSEAARRHFDW